MFVCFWIKYSTPNPNKWQKFIIVKNTIESLTVYKVHLPSSNMSYILVTHFIKKSDWDRLCVSN